MKAIVNYDLNYGIGYKNQLLYKIPEDLQFFKKITTDNGVILMGSKTFASLNCKPLPDRLNIVLSKKTTTFYLPDKTVNIWQFSNPELLASLYPESIIIGGSQIYTLFEKYINLIYATEVFEKSKNADSHFHNFDNNPDREYHHQLIKTIEATGTTPKYNFSIYLDKQYYDNLDYNKMKEFKTQ